MTTSHLPLPLVSVLIPVYKAEPYIERCLRSVLCQTYPELEIVLVDDASPDDSMRIAMQVAHAYQASERVHGYTHATNRGAVVARQTALDAAKGDYLLWLDSDDYLHSPDTIYRWIDHALEHDADVTTSDYIADYHTMQRLYRLVPYASSYELAIAILRGRTPGFLWNKLVRRSVFPQHIGTEGQDLLEDVACLVPMLLASELRMAHYDAPTVHYTQSNDQSLLSHLTAHKAAQTLRLASRLIDQLDTAYPSKLQQELEAFALSVKALLLDRVSYRLYPQILAFPYGSLRALPLLTLGWYDATKLRLQYHSRTTYLGYLMACLKRYIKRLIYGPRRCPARG